MCIILSLSLSFSFFFFLSLSFSLYPILILFFSSLSLSLFLAFPVSSSVSPLSMSGSTRFPSPLKASATELCFSVSLSLSLSLSLLLTFSLNLADSPTSWWTPFSPQKRGRNDHKPVRNYNLEKWESQRRGLLNARGFFWTRFLKAIFLPCKANRGEEALTDQLRVAHGSWMSMLLASAGIMIPLTSPWHTPMMRWSRRIQFTPSKPRTPIANRKGFL